MADDLGEPQPGVPAESGDSVGWEPGVPAESADPVESEEVILIDEAGAERRFLLHDAFDADGETYYLVESADDPEEVLLLKDAAGTLETVDQEEFDRVISLLEAE